MQRFVYQTTVRFTHTDPASYVFFPRYFEMLQATVEDWFTHALEIRYADIVIERGLGLPTAHTECDFLKPCRLGERLGIAVVLEKLGRTSISLRFDGAVDGEPRLCARSVLVVIGLDDGRPVPIAGDLREKLSAYAALPDPEASGG